MKFLLLISAVLAKKWYNLVDHYQLPYALNELEPVISEH